MEIPYQQLSKDTLRNLITEFVCAVDDSSDQSVAAKIEQVTHQLKTGAVIITYSEENQSCYIQKR